MKILKIFGIVVGIHLFALILILANPGCSSTSKPAPQPSDTVAKTEAAPAISVPSMAAPVASAAPAETTTIIPVVTGFNPDAPATYANSAPPSGIRFTPTRPNTPAASAVVTQPVENVTPATTYTVKAGDSLWTLQKKFHLPLKEIAAANNLKTSTPLHEGQKLLIPSKAMTTGAAAASATKASDSMAAAQPPLAPAGAGSAAELKSASTRPTNEEFKYVVKSGETLGSIARKFDVRTRDLAVHNNIADPKKGLRAGMELSIPGWQPAASGGKASKGTSSGRTTKSTPSTSSTAAQPAEVPNILESGPSPSTPNAAPSGSVPVINIDETPTTTPAPKS